MATSMKIPFQYTPGDLLTVDVRLTNSSSFIYSGLTTLTAIEEPQVGGPYAMSNYYVNLPLPQNGTFDFLVKSGAVIVSVFQRPVGCGSLTSPQVRQGSAVLTGQAFSRVFVDRLVAGKTVVTWRMSQNFTIPGPFTFWLQASYAGHANAVDWVTVAGPSINVTQLADNTRRETTGKHILTHYRVMVSIAGKLYVSEPSRATNRLPDRDYLIAREIIRKEQLQQKNSTGIDGFLLRAFRYGVTDKKTTFSLTGDVIDTYSASSWGTSFEIGYHPAIPQSISQDSRDNQETQGDGQVPSFSTATDVLVARVVGDLDIVTSDVWVNAVTDERFTVDNVKQAASVRGVTVVRKVTMHLLPFSSPLYRIPVDGFN